MSVYDLNDIDSLPDPTPVQSAPKPQKKKKRIGVWILVFLLVCALAAEPFVLDALKEDPVSVARSEINDQGQLILHYTNGTSENLGVVVGKDGTDGKDGVNGADGKDGLNGTDGAPGSGGNVSAAAAVGLRSAVSVWCTFYEEDWRGRTEEAYSAGSGVIYQLNKAEGDAFVITNYHVVFDPASRTANGIAEEIVLYLYGGEIAGKEIQATYVGGSQYYDIAVLRIEDSPVLQQSDATAVKVADSDQVQVGDTAIAVGNPEGAGISASSGVISVDSEHITMTAADGYTEVDYRVMRIDTAVNSGNSGGGLYNSKGQLIGIVNAKTIDESVENIGYALPSTSVVAVADNIIDYCFGTDCENVRRPIMGVTVMTVESSAVYDSATGRVSIVEKVEIQEVSEGQIGQVFQPGDILVSMSLNGRARDITRQHHVIDSMLTARAGDQVEFVVLRDGTETTLSLTVTEECLTDY